MKKTELDHRIDIMRKLADIKNSQESLIEKIGHVQVDLLDRSDKKLEDKMDQLNADASKEFEEMKTIIEEYQQEMDLLD